jgi:hypothetical protein
MATYRLFCIDDGNHITVRQDFDADDDAEAIAFAETNYPGRNCEIWELGRKVAEIAIKRAG